MSNGVGGGGDGRSTGGSEAKASQRFCFHDGDTRDGWQGGLSPIFFTESETGWEISNGCLRGHVACLENWYRDCKWVSSI
jgi:hypothetical protein